MIDRDALVELDSARGRGILAAAVLGSAVTFLTGTVVNVALPQLGRDLGAGTSELQWVLNGYLLTLAALILLGGALGDRLGRRRMFLWGCVGFALASVLCALAPSVWWLVTWRVVQGVFAALLIPESLAILESVLRPQDRGRAIGSWSALGGIAAAIGPLLGGWLVDVGSWRWVFVLNLPIAVAALITAWRFVPESRDATRRELDLSGAATVLLALAGISSALVFAAEHGPTSPRVRWALLVGVAGLAAFVLIERRHPSPMMPRALFASGLFLAANGVTLVVYTALGGVFFLLTIFLQTALGYSALIAGASLLPVTVLMLALSSRTGDWAQRRGARLPLTGGPLLLAVGLLMMARIESGESYWLGILPAVLVYGLGLSAVVAPVTSAALAGVQSRFVGIASGVNNAVSRTAMLLAVAIVPWVADLGGDRIRDAEALLAGFPRAMTVLAAVAGFAGVLAWLTVPSRPLEELAGEGGVPAPTDRHHRHCAVDGTPLRPHTGCTAAGPR